MNYPMTKYILLGGFGFNLYEAMPDYFSRKSVIIDQEGSIQERVQNNHELYEPQNVRRVSLERLLGNPNMILEVLPTNEKYFIIAGIQGMTARRALRAIMSEMDTDKYLPEYIMIEPFAFESESTDKTSLLEKIKSKYICHVISNEAFSLREDGRIYLSTFQSILFNEIESIISLNTQ
jgi:hypothetical protein